MKGNKSDNKSIGTRIQKLRTSKKMTQEQLAEKINVGCQHISDVERGVKGMSLAALIDVCIALDADSDYILFGKILTCPDSKNPINDVFKRLSSEQMLYAEQFIKLYAKSCGIK